MERIGISRRLLAVTALATTALVFGGCDWTMFGNIPALTHDSPDTAISGANVSNLQPLFTGAGAFGSPVESNGVVYAGNTAGNLEAFDANGVSGCSGSPNQCRPLWTGTTAPIDSGTSPAVANGIVYILSIAQFKLYAFDAKGVTGCSGSPKVCQPVWTAGVSGAFGSPIVSNGVVYVGGGGGVLNAFDANGVTNCSGSPKECQPSGPA
jgi:outer membrane protein assembly factor BamB